MTRRRGGMMVPVRVGRRIVAALLFLTLGCYQYVPSRTSTYPAAGRDVRVQVTEEGARRLQLGELFPESATSVEGEVLTSNPGGMEIRVPIRDRTLRGFRQRDIFQRIRIQAAEIQRVDLRQIDRAWTGLMMASGMAALVALLVRGSGGTVGGDTAPPPPEKN